VRPRACALMALAWMGVAIVVSAGDWAQWRGPHRDGHAAGDELLPESLPEPEPAWTVPLGGGFSGVIVAGDRVFVSDERSHEEVVHALDARTGGELWRVAYAPSAGDEWGSGPRCTPLADDGRVYLQSLKGEFVCVSQEDGRRLWGTSFERDYGVTFLGGGDASDAASRRRGHNGSPVVLGDRIHVAVGSAARGTVVAFDKRTGREVWRAGEDETAYAGLMLARSGAEDHVIGFTATALGAWNAADGSPRGSIPLRTAANRHAVTPLVLGNRVIVSSHTLGLRAFDFVEKHGAWEVRAVWEAPSLKTSLSTGVVVGGHLYGQGPDRDFVCVEVATGRIRWRREGFGDRPLVGHSAVIAAGSRLFVLGDDGQGVLVAADPEGYRELSRHQYCGRTWSHPALARGHLYIRDRRQLVAVSLGGPRAVSP